MSNGEKAQCGRIKNPRDRLFRNEIDEDDRMGFLRIVLTLIRPVCQRLLRSSSKPHSEFSTE